MPEHRQGISQLFPGELVDDPTLIQEFSRHGMAVPEAESPQREGFTARIELPNRSRDGKPAVGGNQQPTGCPLREHCNVNGAVRLRQGAGGEKPDLARGNPWIKRADSTADFDRHWMSSGGAGGLGWGIGLDTGLLVLVFSQPLLEAA